MFDGVFDYVLWCVFDFVFDCYLAVFEIETRNATANELRYSLSFDSVA